MQEASVKSVSRREYNVVAVQDIGQVQKTTQVNMLGKSNYKHAIVITLEGSKVLVAEADSKVEKQRWLNSINVLNCKRSILNGTFIADACEKECFNAHMAVTLLHTHRDDATAVSLIVDRLSDYVEKNIDDLEFYLPQVVHLMVHMDDAVSTRLVGLLLSMCKGKQYTEHLGKSMHLALQLFWYLHGMVQDNIPETYNQCVKLLMTVEANVVNQHFDLTPDMDISNLLHVVPGLTNKLVDDDGTQVQACQSPRNSVTSASDLTIEDEDKDAFDTVVSITTLSEPNRQILRDWLASERQKRYKYFHAQRDFIAELTEISERLRQIEPPDARKPLLPLELVKLFIPDMAYIPLGSASDPFCQIIRVLDTEGTVFSTHSRAPCLICFEVVYQKRSQIKSVLRPEVDCLSPTPSTSSENGDFKEDSEIATMVKVQQIEIGQDYYEREEDEPESPSKLITLMKDTKGFDLSVRRHSVESYNQGMSKILHDMEAFGESWEAKKARIRKASPHGNLPGWDLVSLISKSFDDMRQEVFALQLISKFQDIFQENSAPLWLRPYKIISTGNSTGLIETITDAQSLDGLKKQAGYVSLKKHFLASYGEETSEAFLDAQENFLQSLVAYSIVCYLLQIKDRHNGNILLTKSGHLVHIDFGFLLGSAPGGNWSIETAPFKLTKEMVGVLGGTKSKGFERFVTLFSEGMEIAKKNADQIVVLVEIMMRKSRFPCFQGRDTNDILTKLQERFNTDFTKQQTVAQSMKLIKTSYKNKWTARYDTFQRITNGIMP